MTQVRKVYRLMLIKSTFEAIESPKFQQRRDETRQICQNLTKSKTKIEKNGATLHNESTKKEENHLNSDKIWSRFL